MQVVQSLKGIGDITDRGKDLTITVILEKPRLIDKEGKRLIEHFENEPEEDGRWIKRLKEGWKGS